MDDKIKLAIFLFCWNAMIAGALLIAPAIATWKVIGIFIFLNALWGFWAIAPDPNKRLDRKPTGPRPEYPPSKPPRKRDDEDNAG